MLRTRSAGRALTYLNRIISTAEMTVPIVTDKSSTWVRVRILKDLTQIFLMNNVYRIELIAEFNYRSEIPSANQFSDNSIKNSYREF